MLENLETFFHNLQKFCQTRYIALTQKNLVLGMLITYHYTPGRQTSRHCIHLFKLFLALFYDYTLGVDSKA